MNFPLSGHINREREINNYIKTGRSYWQKTEAAMKIQLGCQTTGFNILRFTHQFCCESVVVSYFSLEKHITKPVHKAVFLLQNT